MPSTSRSAGSSSAEIARSRGRYPQEASDRAAQEGRRFEDVADPDAVQLTLKVSIYAGDQQGGMLGNELTRRRSRPRLRGSDRDVPTRSPGGNHRSEKETCLVCGARSSFDQLRHAGQRFDARPARPRSSSRHASSSTPAARKLVEKLRAQRVVEVLGRQLRERAGEAIERVLRHGVRISFIGVPADCGAADLSDLTSARLPRSPSAVGPLGWRPDRARPWVGAALDPRLARTDSGEVEIRLE